MCACTDLLCSKLRSKVQYSGHNAIFAALMSGCHSSDLEQAVLVYFDGRLTEAAVKLAKAAREEWVVEADRLRPTLEQLLQFADYVCTSAHFPQVSFYSL